MRKPALIILGILLLAFISIYYIIPQNITAKSIAHVDATDVNVSRFMMIKTSWKKWWPGSRNSADSSVYTYNGVTYTLQKSTNSDLQVQIKRGDDVLDSHISYLATEDGSTNINWYALQLSSTNPFTRVAQYIRIKDTQGDMEKVLAEFKAFMKKDVNVYGVAFKISKIQYPLLLTTSAVSKTYPSMEMVYGLIGGLQKQLTAKGAKPMGSPMLNVNQTDENEYGVMVALPVDKIITPDAGFKINAMVKGGNLLEAEVKGGEKTIANAFVQLKNFQKDHGLISPAKPFETLNTNRLAEKDTAKWVTTLYWPIF